MWLSIKIVQLSSIELTYLRSELFNTEAGMEKVGSSEILAAYFFFILSLTKVMAIKEI